jgi:hypothetical protein
MYLNTLNFYKLKICMEIKFWYRKSLNLLKLRYIIQTNGKFVWKFNFGKEIVKIISKRIDVL